MQNGIGCELVPFFACSLSSRKLQAEFTHKFNLLQGIADARSSVYKAAALVSMYRLHWYIETRTAAPYPQQHNPYAIPDTPLRYARWKWFIKSVPSRLNAKAKPYSRFLQCAHCRNECPCLHCGTHLWKKRTATQATFINARSKDKSKGERKNAIVSCFGHNQVHKTADNSIQNIKQTEKLPAGYTQHHNYI